VAEVPRLEGELFGDLASGADRAARNPANR
jgi:hypothetical protein